MLRTRLLVGLGGLGLAGCLTLGDQGGEPQEEPGYEEPTFSVEAELTQQSCGTGQVVFDPTQAFDVGISVDLEAETLDWHTFEGTASGALDLEDGAFFITYSLTFDMRGPDDGWLPPCSIQRIDEIEGALDDAEAPARFEATLAHRYQPTEGSDCSDLLTGEARVMERLPCLASYDLVGELQAPPAEEEPSAE